MFFDPLYFVLVAPGLLLALWASFKVKATFKRYAQVGMSSGMSGAEVARALLERNGIHDVQVVEHQGWLTDHYHPTKRTVYLSPDVYRGRSVSSVGVAAHEVGHALQDAQGYAPMALRQSMVAPANFGSSFSFVLIMAGFFFHAVSLVWLGIVAFALVVIFQLVTLPVEFNASSRARAHLVKDGLIAATEEPKVGKVLNAAAMTYVAALLTSILTLLYYVIRFTNLLGSDD